MNPNISRKVSKAAITTLIVVLGFLAFVLPTTVTKANFPATQEGRTRRMLRTQLPDAQADTSSNARQESASLVTTGAKSIRIEISENGTKFTPSPSPVFSDGLPAYGNPFITEGYIYSEGTLNGSNGVNPDGSPQFPSRVIGKWICRGWFVGDGAHTVTGPFVLTHQIFDFGNQTGNDTVTTDGYEITDMNVPFQRAITGGTGKYISASGEQIQTLLAFPNAAGGVNLREELRVEKK